MRKIFISLLLLLGISLHFFAQKDIMKEPIPVAMFQATYAFQLPAFDTKTSFGVNSTIGASFVYKTESNWLFTANGNYIFNQGTIPVDPDEKNPEWYRNACHSEHVYCGEDDCEYAPDALT